MDFHINIMRNIMKRLSAIIFLLLFLLLPITVQAKDYSKSLKTVSFSTLSDKDMEDTIQSLATKIARDCGIPYEIHTSCFDWQEWHILAYNNLIIYPDYGTTICINLSGFRDTTEADYRGCTVEYLLVHTLAHEIRHSYQYYHQNDDSDYGRACKQGLIDYKSYNGDSTSYYLQFIEADAEEFASEYADEYFN